MSFSVKRVTFGKYIFDVSQEVYEPAEDSYFFAENLIAEENSLILDVGTGCGILGIISAKNAANVIAVDINPHAVRCAKKNSTLNKAKNKMGFVRADLLTAFSENAKFDLILFNSPYLPSEENEKDSWIGRSWAGGLDGREVIDRFISQVGQHLKPYGRIFLIQSTLANVEETIRRFQEQRLVSSVKAEQKLPFFETLVLIEAKNEVIQLKNLGDEKQIKEGRIG